MLKEPYNFDAPVSFYFTYRCVNLQVYLQVRQLTGQHVYIHMLKEPYKCVKRDLCLEVRDRFLCEC